MAGDSGDSQGTVVRQILAVLGNITVITALLVYFGWQRSETQAHQLGIDASILGMSTQDYILRSVGPVLMLLLTVAIAGLVWMWADRQLLRHAAGREKLLRWVVRGLGFAWLVLPVVVRLAGQVQPWRRYAYVAYPLAIGAGILLTLYGAYLRRTVLDPADDLPDNPPHEALVRGFAAILIGVSLFWSASNYATVLGIKLADEYATDVARGRAVKVVVYSLHQLHLTAPGVREEKLTGDASYRYTGLLLLDHTGDRYFLISEKWTPTHGVVVVLPDDDKLRLEFVRGAPSVTG